MHLARYLVLGGPFSNIAQLKKNVRKRCDRICFGTKKLKLHLKICKNKIKIKKQPISLYIQLFKENMYIIWNDISGHTFGDGTLKFLD